jgi:hypothetical protein
MCPTRMQPFLLRPIPAWHAALARRVSLRVARAPAPPPASSQAHRMTTRRTRAYSAWRNTSSLTYGGSGSYRVALPRPIRSVRRSTGVRRQHSLTTWRTVDGTIPVVGLGAPADPSRHCLGDPLRRPPREHEPVAASRSAVHPPPRVPASTDNHATFAHVSSVPVQGTPSRREAGPAGWRMRSDPAVGDVAGARLLRSGCDPDLGADDRRCTRPERARAMVARSARLGSHQRRLRRV